MSSPKEIEYLLIAMNFVVTTSFLIVYPILPLLIENIAGEDALGLGLLFSGYAIGFTVGAPFFGYIADRFVSKKTIFMFTLFAYSVVNLFYIVSFEIWHLFLVRFFIGLFASSVLPLSLSLISNIATKKTKSMGNITASSSLGIIIGPGLGGFLFEISFYFPIYASSLIGFVFLGVISTRLQIEETVISIDAEEEAQVKGSYLKNLPRPLTAFAIFIFIDMLIVAAWLFVAPGFIFYFYNDLEYLPVEFGIVLSAYGFASAFTQIKFGYISDNLGRRRVITIGLITGVLFYFAMIFTTKYFLILGLFVAVGIGSGLMIPALKALLADVTKEEYRSDIFGLEAGLVTIGNIIGPILGGIAYDLYNITFVFMVGLSMFAIGLLGVLLLRFSYPVGEPNDEN